MSRTGEIATVGAPALGGGSSAGDYLALLKPRVMSLVVFTALAGLYVAPGTPHPFLAFVAILCIALGAGASGAINMWYDRDIDAAMARTKNRPIPAGRLAPDNALAFGLILAVFSVALMGVAVNFLAAALLALTIVFYIGVYTIWLKRRTPQNIVIGGAAGAFPPMVGWAASTGTIELAPVLLFAIIFLWTPPHFWALALYRADDYARAGVPMMPVVSGPEETRRQILLYSLALVPVALAPCAIGLAGPIYGAAASVLGTGLLWLAWVVRHEDGDSSARRLFGFSIMYLFGLFAFLVIDKEMGLGW